MGTDIHGVFQRRDKASGQWIDVPSNYGQHRHYQLFAVLAGVRNGRGSAGIPIGETVTPIAEPRGLPADFAIEDGSHSLATLEHMDPRRREWHEVDEKLEVWMGDHSHSWLTGDEMLAWGEKAPKVMKTGILTRAAYEAWDGASFPLDFCGGVYGRGVVQINDNAIEKEKTPNWTHIKCDWQSDLRIELAYFFDEISRLVTKHGQIRFVFGFDG